MRRILKKIDRMSLQANQGFTLVEVIVAVTIFSFAVLGLAIGTVALTRANADTHLRASAINVAQARLEELKAMNAATFAALVAACTSASSSGCGDTHSASGTTYDRRWWFTTNSPVAGVNRIDVRVNWNSHGSQTVTFTAAVPQ
jgi:prepilin-type N-terminal cleavage/methylation domain-containing protein